MDLQYLYGSVQEFYRPVTVSNPMPADFLKLVTGQCDRFLRFSEDGHPNNYTWLPTGKSQEHQLLFCRTGEKKLAHAPSYFLHAYTLSATYKTLLEDFESLLQTAFYSEAAFDALAAGESSATADCRWGSAAPALTIDPQVLRAVLYGIFSRWCFASKPVVIGVPASEDYDSYTYRAVCAIYGCLPAAIRGEMGFMTYAKPDEKLASIGLFFVPEDVAPESAIYLDARKGAIAPHLENYLNPPLKEMLDKLACPESRQELLVKLLNDVELRRGQGCVRANDYLNYYVQLGILDADAADAAVFAQWLTIATDEEACPEGLRKVLLEQLPQKVTEAVFLKHTESLWSASDAAALAESVQKYLPLCRYSAPLAELVSEKIKENFDGRLASAETLSQTDEVLAAARALRSACGESMPADSFMDACHNKQVDMIGAIYAKACQEMEQVAQAQTDPFKLWDALIPMYNNTLAALAGDRAETVAQATATAGEKLEAHAVSLIQTALAPALVPTVPEGEKNSAYYEAEIDRLTKVSQRLTLYKTFTRPAYLQTVKQSIEDTQLAFTTSGVRRDEALDHLGSLTGYFASLIQLDKTDALSSDDKATQLNGNLRHRRPEDLDDYLVDFHKNFGAELSFESLSALSEFIAKAIRDDLVDILAKTWVLDLTGLRLFGLSQKVARRAVYSELFCKRPAREVTLVYGAYKTTIPTGLLQNFTKFLDNADGRLPGSEKDLGDLVLMLYRAGVLEQEHLAVTLGCLTVSNRQNALKLLLSEVFSPKAEKQPSLPIRCTIYEMIASDRTLQDIVLKNKTYAEEFKWYRQGVCKAPAQEAPTAAEKSARRKEAAEEKQPPFMKKKKVSPLTLGLVGLIVALVITVVCMGVRLSSGMNEAASPTETTSAIAEN